MVTSEKLNGSLEEIMTILSLEVTVKVNYLKMVTWRKKYKANDKWDCVLVNFFNDAVNLTVGDAKWDRCGTHQSSPLLNCCFSFYNFLANFGESLPFFVGFA